nr:MAG TPA: hypothetical protein [Bacteriophage sp.]
MSIFDTLFHKIIVNLTCLWLRHLQVSVGW